MSEQDLWHFVAITIYVLSLIHIRRGLIDSTSWFCIFFAIGFSGNVLGYPLALLNDPFFEWMKGMPATTLHGQILCVAMTAAWTGHLVSKRRIESVRIFRRLPVLSFSEFELDRAFRGVAVAGALGSAILSATGFYGYFTETEYLTNPPAWLDTAKTLVSVSSASLLLVIATDFRKFGKLAGHTHGVIAVWLVAGFLTGFKTPVVRLGLYVLIGAWSVGQVKPAHFVWLGVLIVAAYSVIEPMRAAKFQGARTAQGGVAEALGDEDFQVMELPSVVERFSRRVDYTRNAVRTLTAFELGRTPRFKEQLDEYFRLTPLIAVIPRLLWPDKPVSNLGGVLNQELTGRSNNSITPSMSVVGYIWGGWFGLVLINGAWGLCCTVGGQIFFDNRKTLYQHAPFMLFAIVLSNGAAMMASAYVRIIRVAIVLLLLRVFRMLRV